jgi:putative transcription factor
MNYEEYHCKTVILRNKYDKKQAEKNAQRNGNTSTIQKNVQHNTQTASSLNTRKLDENNDADKHKTIDKNISRLIIQARCAKKWSQKDLANNLNKPHSEIINYENGKAIPNNKLLQLMERKLGVKLLGINK